MIGHLWLRFLEWKFNKFHTHTFDPTSTQYPMGAEVWVRFSCRHCDAYTWDLLEEEVNR